MKLFDPIFALFGALFVGFGNLCIATWRASRIFAVDFVKFSPLMRPFRALVLAYGYVLRGEKVEPGAHPWRTI